MLFAYVSMKSGFNNEYFDEEGPCLVVSDSQHVLLMALTDDQIAAGDRTAIDILREDLLSEGLDVADLIHIAKIELETGTDGDTEGLPDPSDPDTRTVFQEVN